jgi:hypothetical protein
MMAMTSSETTDMVLTILVYVATHDRFSESEHDKNVPTSHIHEPETPSILNPALPASFRIDIEEIRATIMDERSFSISVGTSSQHTHLV